MKNPSGNPAQDLTAVEKERKLYFLLYWALQTIQVICGICLILMVLSLLFSWGRWAFVLTGFCIPVRVIIALLFNNYRTCPRCGYRVSYKVLKGEPGGGLYCPHCRDTFSGKFFD